MGIDRLGVEEAKDFWFEGDLTIYTLGYEWVDEVIALPKIEVERGLVYLRKLKSCKTYEEAQNLYLDFCKDPKAPKLIPRMRDLRNEGDILFDLWEATDTRLPHDQDPDSYREEDPSVDELVEITKHLEFNWNESPLYHDDNGIFAACRNIQIWTDAWIPLEIAVSVGTPDLGFGIDYYAAENLYQNQELFIEEFLKFGIKIEINHPDLRELVGH
jgi:hypothetical protein